MMQPDIGMRDRDPHEPLLERPESWRRRAPVDADTFRTVLGHSPTAVGVLTTRDADGCNHGITVSSYAALSLEPPLVLACIDHRARIQEVLRSAASFSISVLSADQEDIARRFSSRRANRFAGIATSHGLSGNMLISGALAHIECDLVDRVMGGDHFIIIGGVKIAQARPGRPLLHFCGAFKELADRGHPLGDREGESSGG
jgi:flavin reductase (DIM6/NTAB) family NADH-FMN oxidoreductase RutF